MHRSDESTAPHDLRLLASEPQNLAFVKRIVLNGVVSYGVMSGEGEYIGMAPDRETAFAVARQYDYEPVSVH